MVPWNGRVNINAVCFRPRLVVVAVLSGVDIDVGYAVRASAVADVRRGRS